MYSRAASGAVSRRDDSSCVPLILFRRRDTFRVLLSLYSLTAAFAVLAKLVCKKHSRLLDGGNGGNVASLRCARARRHVRSARLCHVCDRRFSRGAVGEKNL